MSKSTNLSKNNYKILIAIILIFSITVVFFVLYPTLSKSVSIPSQPEQQENELPELNKDQSTLSSEKISTGTKQTQLTQEEPTQTESEQTQSKQFSRYSNVKITFTSSTNLCQKNNSCYSPSKLIIKRGTTVGWTNADTKEHTVTSGIIKEGPDGLFNSGIIYSGDGFEHKFDVTGNFPYYCTIYPWMKGRITVE